MDNLYNANIKAVERIEQITGKKVTFYQTDMLDREGVKAIFDNEKLTQSSTLQVSRLSANLL